MVAIRWITPALLLILGATAPLPGVPAPEPEGVTLRWKLDKGKTFYVEMSTDTTQKMVIQGQDLVQRQKQSFLFACTPKGQDKDKNWELQLKFARIAMEMDIGGNKINYDSANPANDDNPLTGFFKAMVGAEFTLTLSPTMQPVKITGREELLNRLGKVNEQMKPLLEQILNEEAQKQMMGPVFAGIPPKSVSRGATWTQENTLALGPIGSYQTRYAYTYEGRQGRLDIVKADVTLKYKPPQGEAAKGLPFRIKDGTFNSGSEASAIFRFNRDKGRLETSETYMDLKGKLTIDIGGQETEVELAQTQKTVVKVRETPPPKK
jgi:hypothetical protein